ncbi:hypothetical protein RUND412_007102 [Rhizina undulata]
MPTHYQSERLHVHLISSPLRIQIPHAVGAAYGLKLEDASHVVICYFGEGAASEGDFHAALNIAATRNCPVVFICRNNGYAISTPTLEQYKGDGIASRGIGYGIETIRVDGNDIMAVMEVTKEAREIALRDHKPVLIEAMSYRVSHHSTSDDSSAYRAKMEVEDTVLRARLRKEILHSFGKAEKEKKPPIGSMFMDVFEKPSEDIVGQMRELRGIMERFPDEYQLSDYKRAGRIV